MGNDAHDTWNRLRRRHLSAANQYRHLTTLHTSGRGIIRGGNQTKADGVAQAAATLRDAIRWTTESDGADGAES